MRSRAGCALLQVPRDPQTSVPQRSCAVYHTGLCCDAGELEQPNVVKGMRYTRPQGAHGLIVRRSYRAHH